MFAAVSDISMDCGGRKGRKTDRYVFGAHSLKSLKRNILGFCGIAPVRSTIIGSIEGMSEKQRMGWLDEARGLGELGR